MNDIQLERQIEPILDLAGMEIPDRQDETRLENWRVCDLINTKL